MDANNKICRSDLIRTYIVTRGIIVGLYNDTGTNDESSLHEQNLNLLAQMKEMVIEK